VSNVLHSAVLSFSDDPSWQKFRTGVTAAVRPMLTTQTESQKQEAL